jgi:hypothetical protein
VIIVGLSPLARVFAVAALAVLFQQVDHNVHGLVGRFAAFQAQPQEVHTQSATRRCFRKNRCQWGDGLLATPYSLMPCS